MNGKLYKAKDINKEKVIMPDFLAFPMHKKLFGFKTYSQDILLELISFLNLRIDLASLKKLQACLKIAPTLFELKVISSFWSCGKGQLNSCISEIQVSLDNYHILKSIELYNALRQINNDLTPRTLKNISNMGYVTGRNNGLNNVFNTYGKYQKECAFYDKGIRSNFYLTLNTIWDQEPINALNRSILNTLSNGALPLGAIYKEYSGGSFNKRLAFSKLINGLEIPAYECPACMETSINLPVSKLSLLGFASKANINTSYIGRNDKIVLVKSQYSKYNSISDFYKFIERDLSVFVSRVVSCTDGILNSLIDLVDGFDICMSEVPLGAISVEDFLMNSNQEYMIVLVKNNQYSSLKKVLKENGFDVYPIGNVTKKNRYRLISLDTELMNLRNDIIKYRTHDYSVFRIGETIKEKAYSLYDSFEEDKIGEYFRKNLALGSFYPNNILSGVSSGQLIYPPLLGHKQLTPMHAMPLVPCVDRFEDACVLLTSNVNRRIGSCEFSITVNSIVSALLKLVVLGVPLCDIAFSGNFLYDNAADENIRGNVLAKSLACLYTQNALGVGSMGNSIELMEKLHYDNIVSDITAIGTCNNNGLITNLFKKGDKLYCFHIPYDEYDIPDFKYILKLSSQINMNINIGNVTAGRVIEYNIADSIIKGTAGDALGFSFSKIDENIFKNTTGDIILAVGDQWDTSLFNAEYIGVVDDSGVIHGVNKIINQQEIERIISKYPFENNLYDRLPMFEPNAHKIQPIKSTRIKVKALIIHSEDSSERCFAYELNKLGYEVSSVKIPQNNSITHGFAQKLRTAIMQCDLLICSGRSNNDDTLNNIYIALSKPIVLDALNEHLFSHEGLILGTGDGAKALLELGFLAVGNAELGKPKNLELINNDSSETTARLPRVKIINNHSPFFNKVSTLNNYVVATSGSHFKFNFTDEVRRILSATGQIAMQFVDCLGYPTIAYPDNPYGSQRGVAGLTSPDAKILGLFIQPELTTKLKGEVSLLTEMLKSAKDYFIN